MAKDHAVHSIKVVPSTLRKLEDPLQSPLHFCKRQVFGERQFITSKSAQRAKPPKPTYTEEAAPSTATPSNPQHQQQNQKALNQGGGHDTPTGPDNSDKSSFWSMVKVSFDHCEETQALFNKLSYIFQSQVSQQFLTHSDSQPLIHNL